MRPREHLPIQVLLVLGSLCLATTHPAWTAPSFQGDTTDFFQHQKWGTDAGGDRVWERGRGWSLQASVLNQLYYWKKKGYATLPDGITQNANWLGVHNTELKKLFDDWEAVPEFDLRPPATKKQEIRDPLNYILNQRGVGPLSGVKKGLVRQVYYQIRNDVLLLSTDGTDAIFFINETLYDRAQEQIGKGSPVQLILKHPDENLEGIVDVARKVAADLTETEQLRRAAAEVIAIAAPRLEAAYKKAWWFAGFHAVSVAGFDKDANPKKVWFADPDCNPTPGANANLGNRNADGGWTNVAANQDAADATTPIHKRRFQAADPVPVADPAAADTKRYFESALSNDRKELRVDEADYDRYHGIMVVRMHSLQALKAGAPAVAPRPLQTVAGLPDGTMEFSPGYVGAPPFDEFWLFPGADTLEDPITFDDALWTHDLLSPGSNDPWGRLRPNGGVHGYVLSSSAALADTAVLQMEYVTRSGLPLDRWDLVLLYQGDDATRFDQVVGADSIPLLDQATRRCEVVGPNGRNVSPGTAIIRSYDVCSLSTVEETFVCTLMDLRGWSAIKQVTVVLQPGQCVTAIVDTTTTKVGCSPAVNDTTVFIAGTADAHSSDEWVVVDTCQVSGVPALGRRFGLLLAPPTPNPASRITRIAYEVPRRGPIQVFVYDVLGRLLVRLADREVEAGPGFVTWDGRDRMGALVRPGTYFVELRAGDARRQEKIVFAP